MVQEANRAYTLVRTVGSHRLVSRTEYRPEIGYFDLSDCRKLRNQLQTDHSPD